MQESNAAVPDATPIGLLGGLTRVLRHRAAVAIAEDVLLILLVGVFLWRGFLPAWNSLNTDFPDYYLAARLYHEGFPVDQIYDWTWMQRQKDHAGIDRPIVTFALLTPFSLLPIVPFSASPPLPAKRGWLLVNLALLALVGHLLCRISRLGARRVAILMFLAVLPLRTNFLYGQEYVLLLLLFTAAAWFHLQGRQVESGLTLAIGGALKIYPALFLLFFLRKKQWGAAAGLAAGFIALWLVSVGLFGLETIRSYFVEVLPWPLRGEGQDPYNIAWNSFSAVLHRLFIAEPQLNPHPLVHLPALYAILQPICQATIFVPFFWLLGSSRLRDERESLSWGTFVAMLLILSTNPASYDFLGLILTVVLAVGYLVKLNRLREAAGVVILYAWVCYPMPHLVAGSRAGWQTLLAIPRLWAMTALWVILLIISWRSAPAVQRPKLKSPEAWAFGALWLTLVIIAAVVNIRHFRGQFESYANRLIPISESHLDRDPSVHGERMLFTEMLADGYHTGLLNGSSLVQLPFKPDSFQPATAPGSPFAWIELASRRSRVIRFRLDAGEPALEESVVEAEDAERPAASPDGRYLLFIREKKGRGILWLKKLQAGTEAKGSDEEERPLSGDDLNVMEAAFERPDEIIFAARRDHGRPALFRTDRARRYVIEESAWRPRRYPAASPDGHWLAFSQLEGSNWQLWLRDLTTGSEHRLTNNDCNSITPSWYPDSRSVSYATDCGRGYGLTALCRIQAVP